MPEPSQVVMGGRSHSPSARTATMGSSRSSPEASHAAW
jgi:hypothetical protein